MASYLPFQMRGRPRQIAVSTAQPTISYGNGRVGTVFSVTGLGLWSKPYVRYTVQWQQSVAPFLEWTDIAGATGLNFPATTAQIDKRVRALIIVWTLDSASFPTASLPTSIVQDNPAQDLHIVGTPVTTATIGREAQFAFTALGGRPAASGAKYSFAIIGTPPPGTTLEIDADSDQGICDLGTANGGTWNGLRIRVTDSAGATADIGPFNFSVIPEGTYQTPVPGAGWAGLTQIGTNFGSPSGVGYGHQPTIRIDTPTLIDIDAPYIAWIYPRMTGDQAAFDALNPDLTKAIDPTYGMADANALRVAFDGGTFVFILKQWNPVDKAFGYPVRIDPSLWPDGVPGMGDTGQRMMRVIARPKNGNEAIMQGRPGSSDPLNIRKADFTQAFRFSTNANGTLPRAVRYFSNAGSSGNTGLTEGSPKQTMEQALATIPSNEVNGCILEATTAGNYSLSASVARTATTRYVTVRGKSSLGQSAVVINNLTASGLRVNLLRLKHLKHNRIIEGNGVWGHTIFEDVLAAREPGYSNYNDGTNGGKNSYHANAGAVYFINSRVTEYANAYRECYLVRNCTAGKIGSDLFTNCLFAINVVCDELMSGEQLSSVNPRVVDTRWGNFHPDAAQYLGNTNTVGKGWTYGAILINTVILICDGQGPFFKDCQYVDGIFIENAHWDMSVNTSRNSFRVCINNYADPKYPYTILRNSHFLDCYFHPGNATRDIGQCEDVIFGNCRYNGAYQAGSRVYRPVTGYRPPY